MQFAKQFGGAGARVVGTGLYYLIPNLARFNIGSASGQGLPPEGAYIVLTLLYGGAYIILFLAAAMAVFARRDLK